MATKKSGIPVKSRAGLKTQSALVQHRTSNIPIKEAQNVKVTKSNNLSPEPDHRTLLEQIKSLETAVRDKDSAINDLNEKLVERMNECQVLRDENEAARKDFHLPNQKVTDKMKDLEKLLNDKETFIEDMITNKNELERKFEVELDVLKNQHQIELLSIQQHLEDAHQEKLEDLETSLKNEKLASGRLQEELRDARGQNSAAEIEILREELTSAKLRYENIIFELKQEIEKEKNEKEIFVLEHENDRKKNDSNKEKHKEELETLKYLVQEKELLIQNLKTRAESKEKSSSKSKLYSDEDVNAKLEELRQELATEHKDNLELTNQLWKKKFEEHLEKKSEMLVEQRENENTEKLRKEILDLKEQLQDANELQEEQNEMLEIQEKKIEELKKSNKDFEERYTTLFKETESKWMKDFRECEIVEKIKSHYELEVQRLHDELEGLEHENSNLKTELDVMGSDFEAGHTKIRRASVTARIDMKSEIEDYKVQLASMERELQHALNEKERLKLENGVGNGGSTDDVFEKEKLFAERDELRAKFEENKRDLKKLEKDVKRQAEERSKMVEELKWKNNEIISLKDDHEETVKKFEEKGLIMQSNIDELTTKCETARSEVDAIREALVMSENREQDFKQTLKEFKEKEIAMMGVLQDAKSKISSLEGQIKEKSSNAKHAEEETLLESKVTKLESMIAQEKVANEELTTKYNTLFSETKAKTSKIQELEEALRSQNTLNSEISLEASLNKSNEDYQKLNEDYQNILIENKMKVSKIEKLEKEGSHLRKQVTAFEKKMAMQEREKKSSEEKINSLNKIIEDEKKEISKLEEKCQSYDWKYRELNFQLQEMKNAEETLEICTDRHKELLAVIEEANQEKKDLLAKQTQAMEENEKLRGKVDTIRNERDTLKDEINTLKVERDTLTEEQGLRESEREQDSSEYERKLATAQKKLHEKDRVLNETKKHCRQLKDSEKHLKEKIDNKEEKCLELEKKIEELNQKLKKKQEDFNDKTNEHKELEQSFEEKNKQCLKLEQEFEQMSRQFGAENRKLTELLEETKNGCSKKEQSLQKEIVKQQKDFALKLSNVEESMRESAHIEISRLTQGNNEIEEMRKNVARLSEEKHLLNIRLDDLGIEISKEKEEKYKVEKLKDQFRFQVQSLQERLDVEQEKMFALQNEQFQGEKVITEKHNKLLETLSEYESKNTTLISNIDKASNVLKTLKEKYKKLKEKYTMLATKYTKLNKEKLNKSDVQVGPDTSIDLSSVVEELQRSKETVEETNSKLRVDLNKLREEVGRSEYQVKAVRRANAVLMKQSRCLYNESEEQKRLDEEKTKELQNYRGMKETLQQEKDGWKAEKEILEKQLEVLTEETTKLRNENEKCTSRRNKLEVDLREKASACVVYSRQLEGLQSENEFLYQQSKKLQSELDVARIHSLNQPINRPIDHQTLSPTLDKAWIKHDDEVKNHFGKEMHLEMEGSKFSEMNSCSFDEVNDFIPAVFNNEKVVGDKNMDSPKTNKAHSSSPPSKNNSSKNTNLQIPRNIINNEFSAEKYLGKIYWDTLEYLKKK